MIALCLLLALPRWPEPIAITARVVRVIDGDTLDVEPQADGIGYDLPAVIRLRIADIDAPERGAPGADAATQWLRHRVTGQPLHVELLGWDRFRRLVARVSVAGDDLGEEMVTRGLADRWPKSRNSRRVLGGESTRRPADQQWRRLP